jgi:hypothetical protein
MGYTNVKHFAWGYQGWLVEVDPGRAEGALPKGPVEGEPFPEFRLALLQPERDCAYLGLSPGTHVFPLTDIRAEFVMIVILNEMCTLCMAELPQVNRLSTIAGEDAELGQPELPTIYLLRKGSAGGLLTFWRHTGAIGDPESFLKRLLDLTRPRS